MPRENEGENDRMNPFTRCLSRGLRRRGTGFTGLVMVIGATAAVAQITLDGTLGPAGPLSGPDYRIPAEMGQQHGRNLFHSFGQFNIRGGESATFSGPNGIDNIIGRVTGGEASWIDGALSSTVPDANLYLLNPAGILFGPNARLDVQGSFHASTADYLRLGESGRFGASNPADSLLSTDPPSAFGFLGDNPAPLSIKGSKLQVHEGKTFSLVGGYLTINNSQLAAPSGQLQIASVGFAGEMMLSEIGAETRSPVRGKPITISSSLLDTSGDAAGEIHIIGGEIALTASEIRAETDSRNGKSISLKADNLSLTKGANISSSTRGAGTAGSITVVVANKLEVLGGNSASDPRPSLPKGIVSFTFAKGHAGSITVHADQALIDGNGSLNITAIGSATLATAIGNAGETHVRAKDLKLLNGGIISSSTFGNGHAAAVSVQADHLIVEGLGVSLQPDGRAAPSAIDSSTLMPGKTGNAGEVLVTADRLEINKSGTISSTTLSKGNAGKVTVYANNLIILGSSENRATGITSSADIGSQGNAGKVLVQAKRLIIDGKGAATATGIGSVAFSGSASNSGDTEVTAIELQLQGGGAISSTSWSGNAGRVTVKTDRLLISGFRSVQRNGVFIQEPSAIASSAERSSIGTGGAVEIAAKEIILSNHGLITARSFSPEIAGDITIHTNSLHMENAAISTETAQSEGGNIDIQAHDIVTLIGSDITTSVRSGSANAGSITITKPAALILAEGSKIKADAISGRGGFVKLEARTVEQSADSTITADALFNGQIQMESSGELTSGLAVLPANFFDATRILTTPCAERWESDVIRLTVQRYESLPDSPYGLRAAPAASAPARLTFPETAADAGAENWLLAADGCAGDG